MDDTESLNSDEIERRQVETFRRLHRLVERGYVARIGNGDVIDAIWLDHLAAGPQLIIYPDGKLVRANEGQLISGPAYDDDDRIRNRDPADAHDFDRFIKSVKPPTWWQRGAPARARYITGPGCMILMWAGIIGFGKLLEMGWKALFG